MPEQFTHTAQIALNTLVAAKAAGAGQLATEMAGVIASERAAVTPPQGFDYQAAQARVDKIAKAALGVTKSHTN